MILLDVRARPVIAHRGASAEFPENTMRAFREGLAAGADGLELDVRLAADGVPVVVHDATVDRTTNGHGPVSGYSASALAELDAGGGEPVPTLAEVLEAFPTTPLIIELKEVAVAAPVLALLRERHAAERVLLGSFLHDALRTVPSPPFHRSASRRETGALWTASRVWTPWWPGRYQALTVPETHRSLTVVDRRLVGLSRRQGNPVHVWTVDAPERAAALWAIGVSGIITNRPRAILAVRSEFERVASEATR